MGERHEARAASGILGRHAQRPRRAGAARRGAGLRFRVDGRGLRLGRGDAARLPRRQDQPHQARHRHHAACRAHARQLRHVGGDRRCARRRRTLHRGYRRIGPADRRGLVRPALGQALLAHQGLRRDHAQGVRPRGAGGARGPRDQPALHGARRHGRGQAAEIDPAHAPRHPDLSRHRQRGDREAHRRDRRRLAAARLRAGLDVRVPAVARGRLPPRRQRQGLRQLRDPGLRPRRRRRAT